ncbi:MAG: BCCT family transporter [Alteromonadaceae bacterium]|nr:BCCT family transporter [Alteromonadaceae bacterium]
MAVVYSFVDLDSYLGVATNINNWILDTFDDLFSWTSFIMLVTLVVVYFSPLAKVKIGGKDAKPLLSKWRWFAITLCTTIATGILFWSAAEPMYHAYAPPESLDIQSNSAQAKAFAMGTMFMHWSFTPYAIYCVPSLVFALCFYNLKRSFSIGASLSPALGNGIERNGGRIVDAIALFSLVAGMAASLGTGILILGGGVESVTGIANSKTVMAFVAIAIVSSFVISALSGLQKGIAKLSHANAIVFIGLFSFVLVVGPTASIVSLGIDGVVQYAQSFFPRSFNTYLDSSDTWAQSWTIFYLANWFAWAPIAALFLGKIARGYTVRQFISINLILPSLVIVFWMSTFTGTAMHLDEALNGQLRASLLDKGPESVIFMLIDNLPLASIMSFAFIGATFISFVTAADSNTDAMSNLCSKGNNAENNQANHLMKYVWGICIGIIAWVMVSFASIDGIRMMSNLGGLPAMFIIMVTNVSLLVLLYRVIKGDSLEPDSKS